MADLGKLRFQHPERRQIQWQAVSLDQLLPHDHEARLIWAYVDQSDVTPLFEKYKAVEGHVGRPGIHPKILLALWLFATVDGVGSARRLDKLCKQHLAYMWLCGEVSVNYHTLSDFRVEHVEFLDQLLTQSVEWGGNASTILAWPPLIACVRQCSLRKEMLCKATSRVRCNQYGLPSQVQSAHL